MVIAAPANPVGLYHSLHMPSISQTPEGHISTPCQQTQLVHIKVFTCQASHVVSHRAIHFKAWYRCQWAQPSHSSGKTALQSVYLTKWISGSGHLLPIIQDNLDFLVMEGDVAWQSNHHCYLSNTIYTRLKTACPHPLIMELRSSVPVCMQFFHTRITYHM